MILVGATPCSPSPKTFGFGSMAPRRKGADNMNNDNSSKKRKKNEVEENSEAPEWMRSCLKFFDDHVPQAGGITEYLDQRFDTIEKKESFAKAMSIAFPKAESDEYAADWTPGLKVIRPFLLAWAQESGNHGMWLLENQRNLFSLVLENGYKTEAEEGAV